MKDAHESKIRYTPGKMLPDFLSSLSDIKKLNDPFNSDQIEIEELKARVNSLENEVAKINSKTDSLIYLPTEKEIDFYSVVRD